MFYNTAILLFPVNCEWVTDLGRRLDSLDYWSCGESQRKRRWPGRRRRGGRDGFLSSGVRGRRAVLLRHCAGTGCTGSRVRVCISIPIAAGVLEHNVEGRGGAVTGATRGAQLKWVGGVWGVRVSLTVPLRHQTVVAQEWVEGQVSVVDAKIYSAAGTAGEQGSWVSGGFQGVSFRPAHRWGGTGHGHFDWQRLHVVEETHRPVSCTKREKRFCCC